MSKFTLIRSHIVQRPMQFIHFSVLAVAPVMQVKPTDTFLPGFMNIWNLIKILIFKNPQCKSICADTYLSILKLIRTEYTLKLKEGMYMKRLKSPLRKQVFYTLFLYRRIIQDFSISSNIMPLRYLQILSTIYFLHF